MNRSTHVALGLLMTRRQSVGFMVSAGLFAVIGLACHSNTTAPSSTTTPTPSTTTVTLSPTSLAFPINATAGSVQTVTLTNAGSVTLNITSIAVTVNFSETDNCSPSVAVGASCTITVTFNPVQAASGGTLTITDDASSSPQTLTVTGPNVVGANGVLTPSSLAFGTQPVGTTSPPQPVTLTNPVNGVSAALSISVTQITGDGFAIAQNTCGSSLAEGMSCTVSITFRPSGPGPRSGSLAMFDNAPGGLQTASLSGSGQ
jgi:hypothetical protein